MRRYLSAAATVFRPAKFASIFLIWCISLLYVLFQGGKTSLMLFTMVSLLITYLIIGGLGGVRRTKGTRKLFSEEDKGEMQIGRRRVGKECPV